MGLAHWDGWAVHFAWGRLRCRFLGVGQLWAWVLLHGLGGLGSIGSVVVGYLRHGVGVGLFGVGVFEGS